MVQDRTTDLESLNCHSPDRMHLNSHSSKSPSSKTVGSENSGRNSPGSDTSDSVCSNENINIDNSDEESLQVSPYIITSKKNHLRNNSNQDIFKDKIIDASSSSNKLVELQIDNVPSVIVPRTVPCIVLTPPAIFNPGLPLLGFSSVPGRFPQDYPHEPSHVPGLTSTSAFASFPFHPGGGNSSTKNYDTNDFKTENSLNLSQSCKDELEVDTRNGITSKKLAFGIDRILADEKDVSSLNLSMDTRMGSGHPVGINLKSYHTHHEDHRGGGDNYSSQCSECFFLSRYCRRIQFPTTTPASVSPSSFAWIPPPTTSHPADSNSTILSSNSFGQHLHLSSYGLNNSNFSNMSSMVSCNTNGSGRRKRSWSRAVFSNLQRKGLEKRFQLQKYITKPDRRQLAATLGLTDAQVKVWFQNRRMKWRHSKEGKQGTHIAEDPITVTADKK